MRRKACLAAGQGASDQVYPGVVAGRCGQPLIACEQNGAERFGKRHISRVISGKIVSQGPYPLHEQTVRIALQGKVGEIGQGGLASVAADIAIGGVTPDNLGDFDI